MADFPSERDPLDLVAEEFAYRCRLGEQPSVSGYAAKYPQWADQIRELLPSVALMEQLRQRKQAGQSTAPPARHPDRLGDYRILREVGRGGMGIVYEAVQEPLGRHVALKVLPQHAMLDPKKLQRFQREAQAAAQLHHTNIVPVFAVGEEDGLPFYAMQFIQGQGLHEILGDRKQRQATEETQVLPRSALPVAENVPVRTDPDSPSVHPLVDKHYWRFVARTGVQIAAALDYAHRQGTIHRDVKPANILLDQQGTAWLTDFGLARLANHEDLTNTGDIIGTLHYLAPECFQGRAGSLSDVYSLGLTLYELLTLTLPFDQSNPARLIQQVSEAAPPRPRRLNPAIPRDLETIVLKAMARDPAHRYATAAALADDLQRFLDDRPIQARRANSIERLGRWCRRNKAVASLSTLVIASLLLAAIVGWVGYAQTTRALEGEARKSVEAQAATERAEANVELSLQAFEEIFNELAPGEVNPSIRRGFTGGSFPGGSGFGGGSFGGRGPFRIPESEEEVARLKSILKFYDRFAERNATNPGLQKDAAKAHRRVGEIHQRLGQLDEAETAFRQAIAIYEKLVAEFPTVAEYRYDLAETYAMTDVSGTEPGKLEEAAKRCRRALQLIAELPADYPAAADHTTLQARVQGKLGLVLKHQGQAREAETSYRQAVALYKSLVDPSPNLPANRAALAGSRQALADFLVKEDRLPEARTLLEASITDLQGPGLRNAGLRMEGFVLLAHHELLAEIYKRQGETTLAELSSRKAAELNSNLRALPGGGGVRFGSGRDFRLPSER